ncbi:hypothetical protein CSUB01_10438 [Colletotrichum sublineola]|uniref:Protein kinase domain-containing protein n=1 Tax=Colletotrichum sublineola TaxID=1173701 RepID=A0A066XGI8_COLSU|nr:hypothetical protein CSUB01_10438 [Colletotrichum sublineola]
MPISLSSKAPEFNKFCKSPPQGIIAINDTPEPEHGKPARDINGIAPRRRKRDSEYHQPCNTVYHNSKKLRTAAHRKGSHRGFTISTKRRTHSVIRNTSDATSLSSNDREYHGVPSGQERKKPSYIGYRYKPSPHPSRKASDVHVRVVQENKDKNNAKVDHEDGHYIVVDGADLAKDYQVVKLLGQGTFGKVVQARDRQRDKMVAIKITRATPKYRYASRIELRVLATLKENDSMNRHRCIHMRDCFDYRGHICIVTDLLGQSVFDFLKSNNFLPFPNSHIHSFARQLFSSVAFLHDLNLIHTDLKPENILLCRSDYQKFTYKRKNVPERKVLLDTEIRLIDFGSATFQDEHHSSVVSTRHYRAPEIILGPEWSFPCDIWSIGCVLVELFTGNVLFPDCNDLEHLAMMEKVIGQRTDPEAVQAVSTMAARSYKVPKPMYSKALKPNRPTPKISGGLMRHLKEIVPPKTTYLKTFLDLLQKIFVSDPQRRITAKEALQHPWFKEPTTPDDGTEAAKIHSIH